MNPCETHSRRQGTTRARACLRRALVVTLMYTLALLGGFTGAAREFPPPVQPPKPLVLPAANVRVLANGLRVVVVERHALPLVSLHLVVRAGAEDDGQSFGTAELVSALLTEGTTHRSAREIADTVDSMGGVMDTGADWDESSASLSVLKDRVELAFDLLADLVENPTFAPAETERKKKQTLSALEVVHADPAYVADTALERVLYAGTPYSHPADGTLDSVRQITPEILRDFHRRYYSPSNAILAVVGDVTTPEAFAAAEKSFGAWKGQEGTSAPPAVACTLPARRVIAIDKADAVQTEIRVGTLGVPRVSPDYEALSLANQILGGPAANRLFRTLRSRQGLAYSASSDLQCYQAAGGWVIKTSTRTAETGKSLQIALEQLGRLHDQAISDSELESARKYLVGHMALQFETADDVAAQILELLVHNLPLDYWNQFPRKIHALTPDDVWNATRRYADPAHSVVVLVGDVRGFSKELKKLGPVQIIPLDQLDFDSPDLVQPAGKTGK